MSVIPNIPTLVYNPWLDHVLYWYHRLHESAIINGRPTLLIDYISSFSRRRHFYHPFTRARRRFIRYLLSGGFFQYHQVDDFCSWLQIFILPSSPAYLASVSIRRLSPGFFSNISRDTCLQLIHDKNLSSVGSFLTKKVILSIIYYLCYTALLLPYIRLFHNPKFNKLSFAYKTNIFFPLQITPASLPSCIQSLAPHRAGWHS